MRTRRGFGVLATVLLVLGLSACNWPMPGHDADRTNANPGESRLTAATVGGLSQAFAVALPAGAGQPIADASHLYATSGASVRSVDPATGAAVGPHLGTGAGIVHVGKDGGLWESDGLLGGSWTGDLEATTGQLQPAFRNGFAAALRGDQEVRIERARPGGAGVIIRATVSPIRGPARWSGPIATVFGFGETPSFRPTLGTDQLYGNLDGIVVAYDLDAPCTDTLECDTAWALPVGASTEVVLSADGSTAYVGTESGYLLALDTSSGAVRWYASFHGAPVTATPALAGGKLFVPIGTAAAGYAGHVLMVLDASGCGRTSCGNLWWGSLAPGATVTSQPTVGGDVVYVGDGTGVVRAFPTAGCGTYGCDAVWTGQVSGAVDGGLSVLGGRLYVGSASALTAFALPAP